MNATLESPTLEDWFHTDLASHDFPTWIYSAMNRDIRWRDLEASIALDRLPDFHRAFLALRGVTNPKEMLLRRVQQTVERELNKLVQSGVARREGDEIIVSLAALEGLNLERWLG